MEEMIRLFDICDVNKSASSLNVDKLYWTNQQHILRSTPGHLAKHLAPRLEGCGVSTTDDQKLVAVAEVQQERARTLKEMAENSLFFFRDVTGYEEKPAKKHLNESTAPLLEAVRNRLEALPEWTAPAIHEAIMDVARENNAGMGKVAQPVRVAVSGGAVSPPIDVTLQVLGREATLDRLGRAITFARNPNR